jgi:hypothetical protein
MLLLYNNHAYALGSGLHTSTKANLPVVDLIHDGANTEQEAEQLAKWYVSTGYSQVRAALMCG